MVAITILLPLLSGQSCNPPPPPAGPLVLGIGPTEIKDGADTWIYGRGFTLFPLEVTLRDPATNTPIGLAAILDVQPTRIRVRPPVPTELSGRKLYELSVRNATNIVPAVTRIYIRESDTYRPELRKRINTRMIAWLPSWRCDRPNNNPGTPHGPPYLCGCTHYLGQMDAEALERDLYDDNPSDAWSAPIWDDFKRPYDDTSRHWSGMCSAAWGTPYWIDGLVESDVPGVPRVTLRSSAYYWLDIDPQHDHTVQLARRHAAHPILGNGALAGVDHCLDRIAGEEQRRRTRLYELEAELRRGGGQHPPRRRPLRRRSRTRPLRDRRHREPAECIWGDRRHGHHYRQPPAWRAAEGATVRFVHGQPLQSRRRARSTSAISAPSTTSRSRRTY